MLNRRDTIKGLALAPFVAAAAPTLTTPAWKPYARATAIDGAGGSLLGYIEPEDPAVPGELAAIRASGLTAIVLTVAPQGRFWLDDDAISRAGKTLAKWHAIAAVHPAHLMVIRTTADLQRAKTEGKLGIVFTFQGTEPLGEDIERIAGFREQGVRVIQLTHNRRNLVGDGCMESGNAGLSNFGHQVVEQLNTQKIVVDLAHGSARTMWEGIAASKAPVLISHTGCRALADLPRNTDDATLRSLAKRGGVAGIIFWPYLRKDTQPMAIDVVRHIEHAVNICGEDHVGIGTDAGIAPVERTPEYEQENRAWVADAVEDGVFERGRPPDLYTFIPDLNTADRFDRLASLLSARGHGDARIGKILGGNFARVMGEVWGS